MNTGSPTDGEKDQVKLNQQASNNQPDQSLSADRQNIGVGSDNIGVEEKLEPKNPTPNVPSPPPKPAPTPRQSSPQANPIIQPSSPPPPTETPPPVPQAPPTQPPEAKPEAKIEVQTTDIPIKSYDSSKTTDQPKAVPPTSPPIAPRKDGAMTVPAPPNQNESQGGPVSPPASPNRGESQGGSPIKASSGPVSPSHGGPAATIVTLAILALIFGAAGGFFGFRYWDNLKTSASTENSPAASLSPSQSPSANDTTNWPTYTNDKYKFLLQYPNSWITSTTDPQAEDIIFASDQESLAPQSAGMRVEIFFQDSNGKTLKSWVEANSVTANETEPIKEVTVSSQTGYQQEQTNIQKAVNTFLERGDKIMIIALSAPETKMGEAGSWYNSIINSIVLK